MSMREKIAKVLAHHDGMHPDAVSNDEDDFPIWKTYLDVSDAVLDALTEPTKGMIESMDEHAGSIAPECAYRDAIQAARDGK